MAFSINIQKMENSCEDVSQLLKSLGHPRRLLVLGHLSTKPKTVNELVELCGVSQPQMSHFLKRLTDEGLIKCEPTGRYRVYSVADKRLKNLLAIIQKEYCGGEK